MVGEPDFFSADPVRRIAPAFGRRQSLPGEGVLQCLMQIQFADGIAEFVRLGSLDPLAAKARRDFFMPFALSGAKVGKDFDQRLLLHPRDSPWRQAELAFAVLVEHSILQHLLEHLGLPGIVLGSFSICSMALSRFDRRIASGMKLHWNWSMPKSLSWVGNSSPSYSP